MTAGGLLLRVTRTGKTCLLQIDHHLIQLGRIHKPNLDYVVKFLKPFVYSVRRKSLFYFLFVLIN